MKKAALFAMLLSLYSPLAPAQEEPLPPPIAVVSAFLELSADQTATLIEIVHTRDAAVRPIAGSLQAVQQELAALLETSNPDAAAVGTLLVQIHAGQKQIHEIAQSAAASFEQALTDDQRQRLQLIRHAAQAAPSLPAFRAAGLI